LRLYLGYPHSVGREGKFKLKDYFLREISVDYASVPVEVKKKLLSLLDNVAQKDYLFIGDVFYDGIDLIEFALFGVEPRDYDELLLPGYLYGKPTHLIRNLFKETFGKRINTLYDFNLFPKEALVVNVGYTKTSLSFGGELLSVIPLGEFHIVDFFGNYLFNRLLGETGVSNARLRKEGIRGELLDSVRAQGARILFGRSNEVEVPTLSYRRKVNPEEVELALTPLTGSTNYGDFVERPADFSSSVVTSLYRFEEALRERFKVKEVYVIGRLKEPFKGVLERIFPVKVTEVDEEELLKRELQNPKFKVKFEAVAFSGEVLRESLELPPPTEGGVRELRRLFNAKDLKGLSLIEKLTQTAEGKERESFAYEVLTIIKRSSLRSPEEIAYLNHSIAALTRMELPESLFKKAVREIESKAFNWQLPFETKINILYFCHKNRERLKGSPLELFPFLLLTYIRGKKVTEGEKNFIRTVCEKFYQGVQ